MYTVVRVSFEVWDWGRGFSGVFQILRGFSGVFQILPTYFSFRSASEMLICHLDSETDEHCSSGHELSWYVECLKVTRCFVDAWRC